MAFDDTLYQRIRGLLEGTEGLVEKKMFGGVAFLLNGNMACGISADELMVRVKPEETEDALTQSFTRVFDMTGRPMKGWLLVEGKGISSDDDLERWVRRGMEYARTLPVK